MKQTQAYYGECCERKGKEKMTCERMLDILMIYSKGYTIAEGNKLQAVRLIELRFQWEIPCCLKLYHR